MKMRLAQKGEDLGVFCALYYLDKAVRIVLVEIRQREDVLLFEF